MPRSARDSDEDVEVKIGRRTRAGIVSSIPESPIRRSSRNKQSTKQNDSSPDLSVTETSNTQTTRSFRSRAGTVDSHSLEVQRRLRSSKNIVDMNETKDSEVSAEMQPKKITRRSIAAMNTSETPKANTRVRRLTRAGSETKTTPTGRVTRKTRASSMDPESTTDTPVEEKNDNQVVDTPSRTKRRASVLPSQSTVIEEEEKQIIYIDLETPLIEEDESAMNVSPNSEELSDKTLTSLKNESNEEYKNIDKTVEEMDCSAEEPVDHSSHNDHMKVNENVINEEPVNKEKTSISDKNNVLGKDGDDTNNMEVILTTDVICNMSTDSLHSVETTSQKIESKEKSILHVSLEEGEINTSDKENECLNTSNSISKQNKSESTLNASLEEGEINTSNKENECLSVDSSISEQNKNTSNTKTLDLEASINVLDTSVKENKNDQCNDDTKFGNSCLMECSVTVLNCDNLIETFKVNNEIQNANTRKKNNNLPILDITEDDTETSHNKNNIDNIVVMENSDVLNTVSHKILIAEGSIPKQESLLNDYNNAQIQSTTTREEEDNVETVNESTNNTKEINCEVEPEVNVSVISNNALNVSVNLKEDPIETSIKEGNCTENIEITEIQNVNNDINESTTPKDSHTKQEDVPSTNKNQDNMSISTHNSSASHIKQDDIPSTNENQDNMSISTHNSSASHIKQDDIPSTNENQDNMSISTHNSSASHINQDDIPSTNEHQDNMSTSTHNSPTMVLQVSDNSNEESANNTEQMELHSSECLIDLHPSQPSNSIHETNDSSTVTESHDGPEKDLLDEEGSTIKTSSETPKISKRKSVTELNISKTEEEIQKDDVQNSEESDNISSVGMLFHDISADEWKQKRQIPNTEGENNSIHSTSTVKLENDSETECDLVLVDKEAWLAADNLKIIKDKETFDYDSDDTVVLKSKMDYLNDRISNSDQMKIVSKDSTQENDNANSLKLLSKKTQDTLNEKTNIDECDVNVSLQNTSRKEKSLNKSKEDVSNKDISSKSDSGKSSDKQLEEEVELTLPQKESGDHNKSKNKLASPTLDRKDKKNRSLNSSSNKKNKSKEGSKKYNRLHISSSDEEDEANNSENNKGKLKGSEKKIGNKNYSTMVHIGSDSDTCENSSDSSKSDRKNKSLRIPCFLFKHKDNGDESDEFNEDGSSKGSIDSDIDLEYNLGGKTIGKFSDDDIPGDECRASESESSDPDDNGSDLADFVVDDDEVEEEEDEDDEDDEDEGEEEEKNEELDQEMEDMEVTENKSEKKDKDILPSEEKEKDTSNKHLNMSNIKNDKKKNERQKTSVETRSADSDKDEIVADSKVDTSTKLDSTFSEKKKKKKQKLNENNETIEETSKSHLNESELTFTKKDKVANVSLTCSTPKTDFHKHEQFKHNISSEKKKRRYIEKTSVNEESEKICPKSLSTDNSDNNKTTLTHSVNAKKKYSLEKNISADSLDLVKDINFTKPFLAKKAYLNKTMSPSNETPTTKYLKKQKLNDSAPIIKLGETKRTSENISLSDNTKDIVDQDETTLVISEKTADKLELDSSLSAKRKKSFEASADLDDQKELRHKKLIFETGQISEVDDKAELQSTSGNEKENSKCILKVDDGKKKKKNKKNKSFQELDIIDMKAKMVEEYVDNDEKVEVICNIENKKDKKKKKSVENEDKFTDKRSNEARNYKNCIEVEDIPNKKKKKVILEKNKKNKSFQELDITEAKMVEEDVDNDEKAEVICNIENKKDKKNKKNKKSVENEDKRNDKARQHSKKSLGWDVSKSSTSSNVEFSDGACESIDFLKSKHEALQAAKRAAESIKANKHMKKRMYTEHLEKIQQKKEIAKPQIEPTIIATTKRGIKRLSVDVIENLPDIPMRPHKKQKLSQKPAEAISHNIIKNGFTESGIIKVHRHWIPSNCGGTTEFDVVNLKKAKRQLKKIPPIATFRQKMLSRNSRYPVTSYIMYLQKQRALGGDQGFLNQF